MLEEKCWRSNIEGARNSTTNQANLPLGQILVDTRGIAGVHPASWKICCPTFAITNALLGGMKLPVRIPRLDGLQGWPIFDSILFLADADDATELKNPISLFSFRFPRGERNGGFDGNDGIKDGREEGGWAACTCARAYRPPVSGGEIRSDRYVYS